MYHGRGNVGGRCITPMCGSRDNVCGGATSPCVTTGPAWLVTIGGGNWPMTVCITVLGSLSKLWVTGCDVDMGSLANVRPKNGSRFALAMGLDGVVWRSGSD